MKRYNFIFIILDYYLVVNFLFQSLNLSEDIHLCPQIIFLQSLHVIRSMCIWGIQFSLVLYPCFYPFQCDFFKIMQYAVLIWNIIGWHETVEKPGIRLHPISADIIPSTANPEFESHPLRTKTPWNSRGFVMSKYFHTGIQFNLK